MSCGKQAHAPVKHLATKFLTVEEYHWRQLPRRLGLEASAYPKEETTTPHLPECKHSLHYDWRPDGYLWEQIGTLNICRLSGKGG